MARQVDRQLDHFSLECPYQVIAEGFSFQVALVLEDYSDQLANLVYQLDQDQQMVDLQKFKQAVSDWEAAQEVFHCTITLSNCSSVIKCMVS